MTLVQDEPRERHARNGQTSHGSDFDFKTPEEAEAILLQMAQALEPAAPALRDLAQSLAEGLSHGTATPSLNPAEEELRKAQARYRALVEQIPAITFMAPLDGTVTELYVSPQIEQMLGFTAKEWLNNPILWYQQLHKDDQERWQEEFSRTLNAGEHFRSDYRFISRDGKIVWIHGEAKVITDEQGQPLFLQGVAFDITESKEAEEKLRLNNVHLARARDAAMEANRAKSAFLANMSHELRTPLHAIIGFSEMLQEDATDTGQDSFLPDLAKITGSARHLVGLIGNILDLSKIEAGKMDLFLEDFEVESLIEEVVSTVLPLTRENGNALHFRCQPHLGKIHCDAAKLRQMVFNLLSNANKFTERGTITLEASRIGDMLRVSVIDSGIGIAPHQKEKLFRSFSQADDSTTRKYGGTGLGLAICHRFCQMMGGSISVRSELGRGSTFTVEIPVHVVAAEAGDEPEIQIESRGTANASSTEESPAVLVIDDDGHALDLMGRFLTREGLRIVTGSGREALPLARELSPAAIILDVSVPDMGGWSVLTALKEDPALTDIPVILFTTAGDGGQAYPVPATDYLTKPIDWKRLSAMLGHLKNGQERPRVLVLDDDLACRELMARAAAQNGWEVSEASNGWIGLKSVVEAPPDLVLLDLMMPEIDGFEFLRLLRASQAGQKIPVVVVTAKELEPAERQRLSNSVQKILQKAAFSRDELFAEVERLVAENVSKRRPARPIPAPAIEVPAERHVAPDLQRQLEEARAEREAAQAQSSAALAERQQLEEELAAVRQHLREHQQTVELLQGESEEAASKDEELEHLREEIEALRRERDTVAARARQSAPADEVVTMVRHLQMEIEQLRQRPPERDPDDARPRKRKRSRPVIEPVAVAAGKRESWPEAAPVTNEVWHVVFRDENGRSHTVSGTASDIHTWVEQGLLNPTNSRISRNREGPFTPLTHTEGFLDLGGVADAPSSNALPPTRPSKVLTSEKAAPAPTHRPAEWLTWMIPVLLATLCAFLMGWKLF